MLFAISLEFPWMHFKELTEKPVGPKYKHLFFRIGVSGENKVALIETGMN